MRIGVLLAGCGVFDGSEIHESVFTLLAIKENKADYICFAPNTEQLHVLDHTSGNEIPEKRNVLVESARIARGEISDLTSISINDFDALVIPGGFGAAKNLNQWAMAGPEGPINKEVKELILTTIEAKKPIAALCMGPTVVAKALEGSGLHGTLTVGSLTEESPYDIQGISDGMASIGVNSISKSIKEIAVDEDLQIVSAPCYMMEGDILDIRNNVKQAIDKLIELTKK